MPLRLTPFRKSGKVRKSGKAAIQPGRGTCAGFTLLELVVGLTLSVVMIAIAGMGLKQATGSLFQSADHARLAQDAALISGRLTRELRSAAEFSAVDPPAATEIPYRLADDPVLHRFYYDSAADELRLDGEILGTGLTRFRLTYYEVWDGSDPLPADNTGGFTIDVRLVDVEFTLRADDGAEVEFQTRIHFAGREEFL